MGRASSEAAAVATVRAMVVAALVQSLEREVMAAGAVVARVIEEAEKARVAAAVTALVGVARVRAVVARAVAIRAVVTSAAAAASAGPRWEP